MYSTITLRKRELSLESLVWLLVHMAMNNDNSISDAVNQLFIVDRKGKPFMASLHCQLSFNGALARVMSLLVGLAYSTVAPFQGSVIICKNG